MRLILVYLIVYAWILISSLWAIVHTKGFLDTTPSIQDEQSLDRFKAVARLSMRLAIIGMAACVIGVIVGILLILRYGFLALAGVLLVNGVLLGLGLYLRGLEKRARSLPAASDYLAEQHKRISETWVKKPFPDF